jgi:hypothetical protein
MALKERESKANKEKRRKKVGEKYIYILFSRPAVITPKLPQNYPRIRTVLVRDAWRPEAQLSPTNPYQNDRNIRLYVFHFGCGRQMNRHGVSKLRETYLLARLFSRAPPSLQFRDSFVAFMAHC